MIAEQRQIPKFVMQRGFQKPGNTDLGNLSLLIAGSGWRVLYIQPAAWGLS
jgi:hypothetical protein